MQDESRATANNMQADFNEGARTSLVGAEEEATIVPGPGIFHWRKVIPNSLTILATVVGLSAFRLALDGNYKLGVLAILAAGLLDGLDGPVARALHGTSKFGAELDSLSDYVNFGVSPSLLLYFWCLQPWGWKGWGISLVYTICMGCRLARFNAGVDFNASKVTRNFFMGVPAPAGAMLVLLPMVCSFQFGNDSYLATPEFTAPYSLFVAFMLISRVPTFSSKMINRTLFGKIGLGKIILFGLVAFSVLTLLVLHIWLSLIVISIAYIFSFPASYITFAVMSKKAEKEA